MCVCPSVRIHTPCKTTGSFARARRGWLVIAWALAQLSAAAAGCRSLSTPDALA